MVEGFGSCVPQTLACARYRVHRSNRFGGLGFRV